MGITSFLSKLTGKAEAKAHLATSETGQGTGIGDATHRVDEIFKAYIPEFLYKPPFGYPRRANLPFLKLLAKSSYIFSVIKTLTDEAVVVPWEITVKEEFQEEKGQHDEKIKEVSKFFNHPNGNNESFTDILKQLIPGILELDAGIIVKVFNIMGELDQMFVRDGQSFLKNPNIFGYLGDRKDFIAPTPLNLNDTEQLRNSYVMEMTQHAAYFQYGWTAGAMPVPFGKREIVYISANPRYDSIYGRSPLEVLEDVILTLIYGSRYNLGFYENNNMPDGAITLLGAKQSQIEAFRERWEAQFKKTDEFGKRIKQFFKVPISSTEVKFEPFQFMSKELEVLEQQAWFTKIIWMCFGVTAEEMGFTENSNKAVSESQTQTAKRKALAPLLKQIEESMNKGIIPEFFDDVDPAPNDVTDDDVVKNREIPIEFKFKIFDVQEEKDKRDIFEQELRMGVKTPEMVAKDLNIDISELEKSQEKHFEREVENQGAMNEINGDLPENGDKKGPEQKSEVNEEAEGTADPRVVAFRDKFVAEYSFDNKKSAEEAGKKLNIAGVHNHQGDTGIVWMPADTHDDLIRFIDAEINKIINKFDDDFVNKACKKNREYKGVGRPLTDESVLSEIESAASKLQKTFFNELDKVI